MDRRLLTPRWLLAHLVILIVAVAFVRLGVWQLDRHQERQIDNEVGERRLSEAPVDVTSLWEEDPTGLLYRRVVATGVFDTESEVLIRSQVHLGTAGFHVVTPLVGESGSGMLINRGWVPLTMDTPPIEEAAPADGVVTVEGWIHPSQKRPPLGPEDPATGTLSRMSRIDVSRIDQQVEYALAPFYVVQTGGEGSELPLPVDLPDFTDTGPHLAYAIQWFGFAAVGLVGYFFLARRRLRQSP